VGRESGFRIKGQNHCGAIAKSSKTDKEGTFGNSKKTRPTLVLLQNRGRHGTGEGVYFKKKPMRKGLLGWKIVHNSKAHNRGKGSD